MVIVIARMKRVERWITLQGMVASRQDIHYRADIIEAKMTEAQKNYKEAKDAYEAAKGVLAVARHRLRVASEAMCREFDELMRESEARLKTKRGSP